MSDRHGERRRRAQIRSALASFGNEPEMGLLIALNGAFSFAVTVLAVAPLIWAIVTPRRAVPAVARVGTRPAGSKPRVPPLREHRAAASVA